VKLAVLNIRKEPYYRREAFELGLKKLGYTLIPQPPARPELSREMLLISWNLKRGAEEEAARDWERRGGTAIVVENGYLQKKDKTYYAISTHGHNGSGWFPVGDEDRFTPLGFELKPRRRPGTGTEILVRGQRGIGSSIMASPPQWGEKMTEKLRSHGHRVRFIPHPGNFAPRVPEDEDLKNAEVLYIWCSAMGVRALVEGVPVKHHAPHWVCEDSEVSREDALQRMAHGQWHFEEIATGEPFARMTAEGWGPTWP
jgi:hypothetical protein